MSYKQKKFFIILSSLTVLTSVLFYNYTKCESKFFKQKPAKIIVVQPIGSFDKDVTHLMTSQLQKIYPNIILKPTIPFYSKAYVPSRNRYRADVLIEFLSKKYQKDTTVLAITHSDISTTKGNYKDWGVMGLGYRPGNACIVSTFRLNKNKLKEQFYKVSIHELGHTEGLPHCPNQNCFMRDAEGGNPLDNETMFCTNCKSVLVSHGWKF